MNVMYEPADVVWSKLPDGRIGVIVSRFIGKDALGKDALCYKVLREETTDIDVIEMGILNALVDSGVWRVERRAENERRLDRRDRLHRK